MNASGQLRAILPSKSKILLLAACFAPVLLAGCETTQNDTSASFNMAPTDLPLPATVAVVPTLERKEAPLVAEAVGAAEPTSGAVTPATVAANAKPATTEEITTDNATVGQTDMPVMAMAAAAPASNIPLPEPKPLASPQGEPAAAGTPGTPASEDKGVVGNTLSRASDAVEAALTPATYFKGDNPRGRLDELITRYAALYEVPVDLVRRVVKRESNFNPSAFNRGHYGLMQIKHATARGMGYQGPAKGLFDAETNLKYSVKYLRGAYMVANGNHDRADRLYQSGYYYHAKRMGLLDETGLGKDRMRRRAKLPES
jgi:soluble lytic murein transglycosylase-like protein